jgi:hypothetical protein
LFQALKKVVENGIFQRQNSVGRLQMGPDFEADSSPSKYIEEAKRSIARYLAAARAKQKAAPTKAVEKPLVGSAEIARRGVSLLTLNERGSKGVNALQAQGVNPLEAQGVDTLLVRLYADVGEVGALEALACAPHSCALEEVEGPLRSAGRFHALALLLETAGQLGRALGVWQALVEGGVEEGEAPSGAVAEETARASDEGVVLQHNGGEAPQMQEPESHEAKEEAGEEGDFEGPRLLSRVASLGTREYGSFRSSSFRSSLGSPRGTEAGLSPRRSSGPFSWGRKRGAVLSSRLSGQAAVGATNAARVLKRTSDMRLILEHGRWLVRLDPELALAAFTSEEREAPLPAGEGEELLRRIVQGKNSARIGGCRN